MSQMNKTPWTSANNTAKTKGANLSAAKQSLAQGKQMKADTKVMADRMQKNAPNLPGFAVKANAQKLAGHVSAAKTTIANAKAGIKANTPKGPMIGANRTPKK